MKYADAKNLIGTQVRAWTAMNGYYVGELVEIFGSPWRGKVRITGVLKPAAFETARGNRQRRGMRPGDEIEVGGTNIAPIDAPGTSYLEALVEELNLETRMLGEAGPKDMGWLTRSVELRKQQIEAERAAAHAVSIRVAMGSDALAFARAEQAASPGAFWDEVVRMLYR